MKFIFLLLSVFSINANAITPLDLIQEITFENLNLALEQSVIDDTYRIGDEWGKKKVTELDLNSNLHFRRMALSTARVGGATGFYLGQFNGKYVMATNHHVCPSANNCLGTTVRFPLLKLNLKVKEFYGTWSDVDLAMFAVEVTDLKQAELLNEVASNFTFNEDVYRGQELVTIGFGVGSNPMRDIVANRDSDCRVFSDQGDYRFMADPDDLNPGPYKAWSFANGCDVSHGDSGSAMMDRNTGKVVGIIWTGRIPKSAKVQSSAYLQSLLNQPNDDVWKELSYSVPAVKMKEFLTNLIDSNKLPENTSETLKAVLN